MTIAYSRIKDELWTTWNNGIINVVFTANGPSFLAIGYKHSNEYGMFILMSYFNERPAYIIVSDRGWSSLNI